MSTANIYDIKYDGKRMGDMSCNEFIAVIFELSLLVESRKSRIEELERKIRELQKFIKDTHCSCQHVEQGEEEAKLFNLSHELSRKIEEFKEEQNEL